MKESKLNSWESRRFILHMKKQSYSGDSIWLRPSRFHIAGYQVWSVE